MAESAALTSPPQRSPHTPGGGYGSLAVSTTPGGSKAVRRSQVSHAFLLKKEADVEAQRLTSPSAGSLRVQAAINASLAANVALAVVKIYAAFTSGSLAVLSSLVDSILDLTSQALFWYSDKRMHTPSVNNTVAVAAAFAAHWHSSLWYLDSVGAIVISVYIAVSWLATGKEQVERLVGLQADQEFIDQIRLLGDVHHPMMRTDIVRAYHFGNNYLVEMEVILPEDMCVKDAHDISLSLQDKVEELDNVERAFVHVDYLERNYDEHKDPTLRRDSP
ncbi:unnamed protein product [Phytophthora lilii]|uniref:Unnamed protein product n=1 Tax=Phytophthora lilii TaxID=2077276 RepID=A0A9W6WSR6_9STRA|nr:unnamed protein product [Phytophthora lilii]